VGGRSAAPADPVDTSAASDSAVATNAVGRNDIYTPPLNERSDLRVGLMNHFVHKSIYYASIKGICAKFFSIGSSDTGLWRNNSPGSERRRHAAGWRPRPCSADKVFNAEELVIGPLLAREKSVGPRTTARFNTTSIRRTTRARHLENFFRKPHGAVATDDLQAIIREEVSRVG